ncbi:hypothetical protein I6F35_15540 [Bradyrhizobium sp. BRP22]|uniref:hypothetical protein n=1 Tax=Bradyrhizobium sp. BRP22 TaxID=2793821 RepID=UPI001CD33C55|nr:hypothetical protein [Bradyrhizobium sp. BRP22]MCA1454623.1 hypothetical protein [Bradyrhizobium sp. BRP22]
MSDTRVSILAPSMHGDPVIVDSVLEAGDAHRPEVRTDHRRHPPNLDGHSMLSGKIPAKIKE